MCEARRCDPEFHTGANAHDVRTALQEVVDIATTLLGPDVKNIVAVAQSKNAKQRTRTLTQRQWRIVRFGLLRALESL